MRAEVAHRLGLPEPELHSYLAHLAEAHTRTWDEDFTLSPRLAVAVSALIAMGGVPGLVRPRIVDHFHKTAAYEKLRHRLVEHYPGRVMGLETLLRRLFILIPRLVDTYEASRVLELVYEGHPPSSLVSLLAALGVPELVELGGEQLDVVEVARRVRSEKGSAFTLALLESGLLPPVIAYYATAREARHGESAATLPIRVMAGLTAEAAALLVYCAPSHLPGWGSTAEVVSHLARLARVLGLDGAATIRPRRDLLGLIVIDEEAARAYDAVAAKAPPSHGIEYLDPSGHRPDGDSVVRLGIPVQHRGGRPVRDAPGNVHARR